jgi:hypothetical protein
MNRRRRLHLLMLTLTFALPTKQVIAQTVEWIRQFGGSGAESAYSVSADALGNVFVSGFLRNNPGEGATFSDAFFAKYDATGTQLWSKQLSTSGQESAWGISADGFGNVYVQGDTNSSLFGQSAGLWDVWLAKYDGIGNELWSRQLGTSGVDEYGTVAADPLGGAYISGRTTDSLGGPNGGGGDQFLARYSAEGNLLWTRQLASPGENSYSRLTVDGSGNVYIAGAIRDSLFGTNAGGWDAYLAKYDRSGTFLWGKQFGTTVDDLQSGGVSADALGNLYLLGSTKGNLGGQNSGDYDVFLTKFTADGMQLWTRQFGTANNDYGDYLFGGGVATDGLGNVYIAANVGYTSSGQFDGGDVYIAKYDTNGNLVWSQQVGSPEGEGRQRISTDGQGSVYFSGYTQGSFGGPLDGVQDAFLGKIRDTSFLLGDYNRNGTVDAADYVVWRNSVGQTGAGLDADGDASGTIDAGDYNLWRAHFGQNAGSSASIASFATAKPAVPEPASAWLTLLGGVIALAIDRSRHRKPHGPWRTIEAGAMAAVYGKTAHPKQSETCHCSGLVNVSIASAIRGALIRASFKAGDFFLELVNSLLKGAQRQLSDMIVGRSRLLGFRAKLLQFLEFGASVCKLPSIFDGHGTTSTIPFGTKSMSLAKVLSVNCRKPSRSTSSILINGRPAINSASATWSCGNPGPINNTQSTSLGSSLSVTKLPLTTILSAPARRASSMSQRSDSIWTWRNSESCPNRSAISSTVAG